MNCSPDIMSNKIIRRCSFLPRFLDSLRKLYCLLYVTTVKVEEFCYFIIFFYQVKRQFYHMFGSV